MVSDLCGEKLSEAFVSACIKEAFGFEGEAILAPANEPSPHYVLYVDSVHSSANYDEALSLFETALRKNPQYDYAVNLGQLGAIEIRFIPDLSAKLQKIYTEQGRSFGTIKHNALSAIELPI